jgi:CBS-domain-containing membrane protein
MTASVITVMEDASIAEIAELMESRHIKRVPVVAVDGSLVGIVSRANLLQSLASRAAPPSSVTVDDQRIREALLQELSEQDWAGSPDPGNVIVEDGVVHLWGRIRSAEVRRAMVVAAQNIAGVKAVEDHMDRDRDHDNMTWPNWPSPARP